MSPLRIPALVALLATLPATAQAVDILPRSNDLSLTLGGDVGWSLHQYLRRDPLEPSTVNGRNQLQLAPSLTARYKDLVTGFVEFEMRHDFVDPGRSRILLREAYGELFYRGFSARVGLQRIRWGRTDVTRPTDNLVRLDYDDLLEPEYLGVPAVRLRYQTPVVGVEVDWIPDFVPSLYQTSAPGRWVISRHIGDTVTVLDTSGEEVQLGLQYDGFTDERLHRRDPEADEPLALDPQLAARVDIRTPRVEFGFSFFWGRDRLPTYVDYRVLNALLALSDGFVSTEITPVHDRVAVPGFDMVATAGPVNIKAEAAWFVTTDPQGEDCLIDDPYLKYAVGLEWFGMGLIGNTDLFVRVEWAGDVEVPLRGASNRLDTCGVFDEPAPLAERTAGSLELGRIRHPIRHGLYWNVAWDFTRFLALDLRGLVTIDSDVYLKGTLRGTFFERLQLTGGISFLTGTQDTIFRTYGHNPRLELEARYLF